MRKGFTTITALCFALPVWAFDIPGGFEKIGVFSVEINSQPLDLVSTSSEKSEYSDLYLTTYADETQRIVNAYTVQAAAGLDANGQAVPPILSVEFDQNPKTGTLTPARVILVDQNRENALASYPEQTHRDIEMNNLVFNKNGVVSFDITADLVRLNWDQYLPVPNTPIVRIQGRFSGKFPAFALETPYDAGDD